MTSSSCHERDATTRTAGLLEMADGWPSAPGAAEGKTKGGGRRGRAEEEAVVMAAGEHAGGKVEEVDEVGGAAPGSLPPNARRRARPRARPICAPPIPALVVSDAHGHGICVRRRPHGMQLVCC